MRLPLNMCIIENVKNTWVEFHMIQPYHNKKKVCTDYHLSL